MTQAAPHKKLAMLTKHLQRAPYDLTPYMPEHFRLAAVMLLLWQNDNELYTVVTKRPDTMPNHSGQWCLPGGKLNEGESAVAGALRETHEELGIAPGQVTVLGRLDDAWSGAGFHMVPVVGWLNQPPRFTPNHEVAELIELPVQQPHHIEWVERQFADHHFKDAILHYQNRQIVGLTTDILLEFFEALNNQYTHRGQHRLHWLQRWLARPNADT